jgi:hypothetical protein
MTGALRSRRMLRGFLLSALMVALLGIVCPAGTGAQEMALFADFSGDASTVDSLVFRADHDVGDSFFVYVGAFGRRLWHDAQLHSVELRLQVTPCSAQHVWFQSPVAVYVMMHGYLDTGMDILLYLDPADCLMSSQGGVPLYFGRVRLNYYLGEPCDILIQPYYGSGDWITACDETTSTRWCVYGHAAVCKDPIPGSPSCGIDTAAARGTWGSIKALYIDRDDLREAPPN